MTQQPEPSAPAPRSLYRLDRAHAMLSIGAYVLVAGVAVLVAFWTVQFDPWGAIVAATGAVVAVLALVLAARLALRPPVVLMLDGAGYRGRVRAQRHAFEGRWKDVRDVKASSRHLRFTTVTNDEQVFPLETIDTRDRARLLRDVYDRLNTAHGYTRFTFD
ncbi:hypothetical protein [Aeromicrobium piscarium]|uniref:PH domain-containing protein n=1 Tax=Aeromicrobium piscarium TaxID=2590901 RepID=A0A554SDK7_9ACTN|nr:hypothetical protein [Aeromicrobium piscarium]TSD64429.1 hypothetical protein FNM00_07815 [Aeromicrobium piscarium]